MVFRRGEFSFSPKMTSDPSSQYLRHVLASKAIHPEDPIPEIPPHIQMLTKIPPLLQSNGQDVISRIRELFPLEVVDEKRVNVDLKRG